MLFGICSHLVFDSGFQSLLFAFPASPFCHRICNQCLEKGSAIVPRNQRVGRLTISNAMRTWTCARALRFLLAARLAGRAIVCLCSTISRSPRLLWPGLFVTQIVVEFIVVLKHYYSSNMYLADGSSKTNAALSESSQMAGCIRSGQNYVWKITKPMRRAREKYQVRHDWRRGSRRFALPQKPQIPRIVEKCS